jgi:NAD(P)-dependent dehydrogenase (short-subunit alcohol dehydrogenase family)
MRGLGGRRVLVAGGATGIGAASARRLAAEGARVAVGDLNADGARRVVKEIEDDGGTAFAFGYDQGDEDSCARLVLAATEALGGLDGLHANAADLSPETVGRDRQLLKMDVAVWERTLRVNLVGYAVLIREVLPHLLQAGGGSIVCTSSAADRLGQLSQPAYAASKAGIDALVRHVASKWGPERIRANAVAPGIVLSEAALAAQTPASLESLRAGTRADRLGAPEDVAGAVAYLMSDDGAWVTGQVWGVDGGLVLRG